MLMKPTRTQHRQKVPLVTPDEINRFGKGKFVMFAPGYQSQDGTQASIPVLARPKLNQEQIQEQTAAGSIWDKKSKQRLALIREHDPDYISDPDRALVERKAQVEGLLPLIHNDDDVDAKETESAISEADQAESQDAVSMAAALNNSGE